MKNQSHPIVVVRRKKHKGHGGERTALEDSLCRLYDGDDGFFTVMWLISISSPKELIQIAEYFRTPLATAVTGGPRISNSDSPIPGGGDDYTQQQGEVKNSRTLMISSNAWSKQG